MTKIKINNFALDENGASLAEYALLLGLITISIITVIAALETKIVGAFTTAGDNLPN